METPQPSRIQDPAAPTIVLGSALATALGNVIQTVGKPEFFHCLLEFLTTICPMHSGGAMIFSRHQRPQLLLYRRWTSARKVGVLDYFSGAYILDPNYQRFLAGGGSGIYCLRDVAPDEFSNSEFYLQFYSQLGLADYIDIIWRIDEDTALSVFLERNKPSAGFLSDNIAAIEMVLPIIFSAVEKHHGQSALLPAGVDDENNLIHRKVQSSIDNFGSSLLTKREREVLFYMLSGYSATLTADRLKSTEGTVKVQRKSIHRKLEIGSQAELFALFIRCIPYATPGEDNDPLATYQSYVSSA
jgi:DNA-binding CsgD family transcriptional regulator